MNGRWVSGHVIMHNKEEESPNQAGHWPPHAMQLAASPPASAEKEREKKIKHAAGPPSILYSPAVERAKDSNKI